jgi:two-component system, NarL family, response regulator NreC
MITLLLAEDAPIIRTALRSMFENMEGISVLGDSPVSQMVETVRKLRPSIIVISSINPQPWHLPLIKAISELPKRSAVMYLSRYKHASFLREFFRNRGAACILDRASVGTLSMAIRRVAAGRYYVDPDVSDEIVFALVGEIGRPRRVLSRREEGVLRLIASGYTHKETARKMGISPTTVETYSNRIRKKLDLKDRSDLVRYALTRGILTDTIEGGA